MTSTKRNSLLPPYSTTGDVNIPPDGDSKAQLPPYTSAGSATPTRRPSGQTSKEFHYETGKFGNEKPISVLTILGSPLSKKMATIVSGKPVKGRVTLDLEKSDSFKTIYVQVQGKIITGTHQGTEFEEVVFLDLKQTLWSSGMGPPRGNNSGPHPQESSSKIAKGDYSWDFSIDIPKEVILPMGPNKEMSTFQLPETFSERTIRPSVNYSITAYLKRNKLWKSDERVIGPFGYVPISTPPPFPPLRLAAYGKPAPLPGPKDDPEGWHALNPTKINGQLFKVMAVEVTCTLFLAKALSYTRGSVIPLSIRLQSSDGQALDLVTSTSGATSSAVVVQLQRRIRCQLGHARNTAHFSWRDNVSDQCRPALWWCAPLESSANGGSERWLNGELHLSADLTTSSLIGPFSVEYSVGLFPFKVAGFDVEEKSGGADQSKPLVEQTVQIVSAFSSGPRPTMHTTAPAENPSDRARGAPTIDDFFGTSMNYF